MSEDSIAVEHAVKELYGMLDKFAQDAAKKYNSTCTKGCAACCYLLALCGVADGYMIALALLEQPDWKSWLPKLAMAAEKLSYKGVNKATYFAKGIPCVFLDVQQGTCKVYENRPACCRFHYVLSDPKLCSHTNPDRPQTAALNLIALEKESWRLDLYVSTAMGWPVPPIAPIPIMVLWMMKYVTKHLLEESNEIEKYCIGTLDPFQWLTEHMEGLIEEGNGIVSEEPIAEFQKAQGK
jgi:Fe-S-cluster containining protein